MINFGKLVFGIVDKDHAKRWWFWRGRYMYRFTLGLYCFYIELER